MAKRSFLNGQFLYRKVSEYPIPERSRSVVFTKDGRNRSVTRPLLCFRSLGKMATILLQRRAEKYSEKVW